MDSFKRGPVDKLAVSLQRRGVWGTSELIVKNIWWFLRDHLSARRRQRLRLERDFDRRYGVETSGIVAEISDLEIPSEAAATANYYEPTPVGALESILRELPVRLEDATFVDIGSGTGRAVFVAMEFPFKQAIGVEISPKLHEIARRNQDNFRSPTQRCKQCQFWLGDATRFEWPSTPLVVYMFNPFGEAPMRAMLESLARWKKTSGHELHVIYLNPVHKALLDGLTFLELIKHERILAIYRGRREAD